jgi:hypothetical protein
MAHLRAPARHLCMRETECFATSEEAWFWYVQCQIARDDGVREVGRLHRSRVLRPAHLDVLGRFGRRLTPPNPHGDDTPVEAGLWEEALDRLTTPLRRKGIVA